MPGVEVQAQLAEQMIEGEFLARPDFADGAEILYLAAIGLLLVCPAAAAEGRPRWRRWRSLFIAIGLVVPWLAFSRYDLCSIRSIRR